MMWKDKEADFLFTEKENSGAAAELFLLSSIPHSYGVSTETANLRINLVSNH